jgi:hypothetical protein
MEDTAEASMGVTAITAGASDADASTTSDVSSPNIRNGIMPHLWGINLSHIYAREVR